MIFMWLIPIGFLVLIVLGVVWVVQSLARPPNRPSGVPVPTVGRVYRLTGKIVPIAEQLE